jgi:radical SAM protein with 4Fe4S-binding SPASM domain
MADFINKTKTLTSKLNKGKLFRIIEIETINRCNNSCHFCPVNVNSDIRLLHKMEDSLFRKVIDELSQCNYSGTIFFHSNNEPLLDNELDNKIAYARTNCKNAFLSFYTNGKLLNLEKILKFKKAGIDKITINNYSRNLQLAGNLRELLEQLKSVDAKECPGITVILRKNDEILNNRGGYAPNKDLNSFDEFTYLKKSPCYLPFREIVVRPDGKVSLCSNDAYGKMSLGDLNHETVQAIWFGDAFNNVREKLAQNKRYQLTICDQCDK